MAKKLVILSCSVCNSNNYRTPKSGSEERIKINKYCKVCQKHTEHVETR